MRKTILYLISFIALPLLANGQANNSKEDSEISWEKEYGPLKIGLIGSGAATIYWGNKNITKIQLSSNYKYFDNYYKNGTVESPQKVVGEIVCFDCFHNANLLIGLDVSKAPMLEKLDCKVNRIRNLDVSKNTKLVILDCGNNCLANLDISKNIALMELHCRGNAPYYKSASLDVSKNTKLTILDCSDNGLKELDISKNIALMELDCSKNWLQGLNINKNTKLSKIVCDNNLLSGLDISKNTELVELNCKQNQLQRLDASKNPALIQLDCSNNKLSAEALNALFHTLHSNQTIGEKIIYIFENQGTKTCDKTIAEKKGWKVVTEKK